MGTSGPRVVRAPRGAQLTCKSWLTEAAYRMIQNNLDPEVAERPEELVVYGGRGQAARSWEAFDAILRSLRELEDDETLLVQSGKPVAVFRSHPDAPRVLIANSNLVPHWATQEHFDELARKGLMMYGQMTAGSWIYIGTQGILQGTYETLGALARKRGWGSLRGRFVLTAGLGGMGGAQPLAITMNEGVGLIVEVDPARARRRHEIGYVDVVVDTLEEAMTLVEEAREQQRPRSIGLIGNAAAFCAVSASLRRGRPARARPRTAAGFRRPFDRPRRLPRAGRNELAHPINSTSARSTASCSATRRAAPGFVASSLCRAMHSANHA